MLNFITNLFYYNFITTSFLVCAFIGMEYLCDPKNFYMSIDSYKSNVMYWCMNKFLDYKVAYDEKIHPYIKHFMNARSSTSIIISNTNYTKHIIDEEVYYSESHIKDVVVSKPFLNFTVIHNNKKFDITKQLQQFLVEGNIICDGFIADFLQHYGYLDMLSYRFDLTSYSYITCDCEIKTCDSISFKVLANNAISDISVVNHNTEGNEANEYVSDSESEYNTDSESDYNSADVSESECDSDNELESGNNSNCEDKHWELHTGETFSDWEWDDEPKRKWKYIGELTTGEDFGDW